MHLRFADTGADDDAGVDVGVGPLVARGCRVDLLRPGIKVRGAAFATRATSAPCRLARRFGHETDDLRIRDIKQVIAPKDLHREFPITDRRRGDGVHARRDIQRILHGEDDRLLVVVGPCSVHDPGRRWSTPRAWRSSATALATG
jgi:hypothetical protein